VNAWTAALASEPRLAELRERLRTEGHIELSGLHASARFLIPLLLSERPLLVVVPTERDLDIACGDLRTLLGEIGDERSVGVLPAPDAGALRGLPRHPEATLQRAAALHAASHGRLRALVASPAGLLRPALARQLFETRVIALQRGDELLPESLIEALDEGGYQREDPVTSPGQIARRGGILDLFPPDASQPVRLEFFGDTLESLRRFDPATQRSGETLDALEVLPMSDVFPTRSLTRKLLELLPERFAGQRELALVTERLTHGVAFDELPDFLSLVPGATQPAWEYLHDATVVTLEAESVRQEIERVHERAQAARAARPAALLPDAAEVLVPAEKLLERLEAAPRLNLSVLDAAEGGAYLPCRPARRYAGDLKSLIADLQSAHTGRTLIFLGTTGRAERLSDLLREDGLAVGPDAQVETRVGALSAGFEFADSLRVLADGDVFPEELHLHARQRGKGLRTFLSDFRDLKIGDYVVHEDHGVGRYVGLEVIEIGGLRRELMVLTYQGGDKLKVPIEAFDRVQRYSSTEGARPAIDRLGGGQWEKVKTRVKKAMRDMASELLRLYAERKARPGHPFTAESPWIHEFEESFEYEETTDQATAIRDVAQDMATPTPMDRLICGDVGYGKTEVAMRAAMRAVLDGKQTAVLAPTTVLAFQHWKTFRKRFAPFPVTIEMISRFRSAKEIKAVLEKLAKGQVDILIGTHRLLSKDALFHDLGLLIIDEEQRFGVAAKERLKQLRTSVDCLTLSATPIPRTLQMGLSGIRDMSVIETPPKDRLAIQTSIVKFSTETIQAALRQELQRDGQVYFVHNRVESIYSLAAMVQRLVPEARIAVAHGQLPEAELEKAMLAFVEGRADVLVATTIIENGLDIPRANTLIVNRADRYGLAQLYQLRGRVGRSDRRACAYLLVPPDKVLSEIARKRLAAMREFSDLGAGFRIAALDLELRGAGNLLGGQQSGHIHAVGFDLYMKLLNQTIVELRGDAPQDGPHAQLNLRVDLRIPEAYVPDVQQRLQLYKRVSRLRDEHEIEDLLSEIQDRYGQPPSEVTTLLTFARLRMQAEGLGIRQVDRSSAALSLQFHSDPPLAPQALLQFVRAQPGASLSPEGVLRLPTTTSGEPLSSLSMALNALASLRSDTGVPRL
jgi:transcription-repair coupling factor (superfamily II helicase)